MLKRKLIFILLILFIALQLVFLSCTKESEKEKLSFKNSDGLDVIITELEVKDTPEVVSFEWDIVTEKEYVDKSSLIFYGTVQDLEEFVIEVIVSEEFTQKIYKTVYSILINDIYYSEDKELKQGDAVKIMSPVSSYTWEPEAIRIKKNQTLILFANKFKDPRSEVFIKLADYYIGNPWEPIIVVKENSYEMDDVFETLAKNATKEERLIEGSYAKEVLIRQDENFISDLTNLIGKYK